MIYPLKSWATAERGYKFGEKTFYSEHHLGLDIIVPEGTEVFAPCDCKIIYSGTLKQGGKTLHTEFMDKNYGKLILRCMHLSELRPKGKYKEGELIGRTGSSGALCRGPHLHIDLSRGKLKLKNYANFIDPEKYFKENVRIKITLKV
jgi:murein DD-endopeptidase MepM/ murein hydrolase activator NlpD